MQKRIARTLIWLSVTTLSTSVWISQYYPDNKFVIDVIPKIGLLAFFTMVGATIAANVYAKSDKTNPEYAVKPALPTFGTAIQKSFTYVILPGIIVTVIAFIVAFALGWRSPGV